MADIRKALDTVLASRNRTRKESTRLDEAIRALQKLALKTPRPQTRVAQKPRRKMSAAARRKIAVARRARWAKLRKEKAA